MSKASKIIIKAAAVFIIPMLIYVFGMKYPKLLHLKHEYRGYTYYSSVFNISFDKSEAEYAFDSIFANEPQYKYLLDSFYDDGYAIFFDDKFTYSWCSGDPIHSNNFTACVAFDKLSGNIRCGMFVNYSNGPFSEKVFFHELSHYADYKLGNISLSDEFARIYDEEYGSSTLAGRSYYLNKKEYFAEEASYFILWDSQGKDTYNKYGKYEDAPKTFDFIKSIYAKMREDYLKRCDENGG